MLKVVTLVGTRPEIIKLSMVIRELDRTLEQILVHTGQNHDYELNEIFFRDLSLRKPDYFLGVASSSAAKTIANTIEKFDDVLERESPDAVLLLGDTNSGLAVISAKRRKIPIFHMEAGNRCFDDRVPEEINRRIIDHVSDINLVYTEHARRYLLSEGIRPDTVFKTGSPMPEVLAQSAAQISASDAMAKLNVAKQEFFLVSAHREENVDSQPRLRQLILLLVALKEAFDKKIVVSMHPRTRLRLSEFDIESPPDIDFLKPLGFFDYCNLQCNAYCVISDSGTLTEESALLRFPAIMIRQAHERPEGMDEGIVIMSELEPSRVIDAITVLRSQEPSTFKVPIDYSADNVSSKVVRLIMSYTDFVNRVVWSNS